MRTLTKDGVKHLVSRKRLLEKKVLELTDQAHEISTSNQFHESPDYSLVIEEKSRLQGEINEIESLLKNATVIKERQYKTVETGCVVRIRIGQMNYIFQLVDSMETNPVKGKISINSPLGKTMLGKNVNDEALLRTPTGNIGFKILEII
ncbi:GreA/GreB family elongation factor [Candidatus Dojkabacteria bacterium]|nr:GreA/GreB family elongation factor [Candidatus Dojkabacteria bacterium]